MGLIVDGTNLATSIVDTCAGSFVPVTLDSGPTEPRERFMVDRGTVHDFQ